MQDIRALRENFDGVKAALQKRGKDFGLDKFHELDKRRRELLQKTEDMKAKQNAASKQIPLLKKDGKDTAPIMAEMKELADAIKASTPELAAVEAELDEFLTGIPNTPHASVPEGKSDADNVEIRRWGTPAAFDFKPKPHWDLGEELNILDPAAAAKITGARFMMFRGLGARL
ncbi:MAG: serine--tRNA ligase, partial [Firmicutes bacterium]|nr:serine--tRNA ligase [Bacillota bacterium]